MSSPVGPQQEHLVDRLLDRTVVLGYTTLGYRLRRVHWRDDDPQPGSLTGKRVLVTGAASGLGEAGARRLAELGADVHLLGRSLDRITPAADRLRHEIARNGWAGSATPEACDVSDLADVRRFTTEFVDRLAGSQLALDGIIHNAGVLPAERTASVEGHELCVATHVLGPILMTELLLPALTVSTAGARIIFVSSGGMYGQKLPVADPDYATGRYRGAVAYARSKRIQVELAPALAERWAGSVGLVATMHPGWADTPGVASSLPLFRLVTKPLLRAPSAGADTIVWLAAASPMPPTGLFWHDRVARPTSYRAATDPSVSQVTKVGDWVWQQLGLEA